MWVHYSEMHGGGGGSGCRGQVCGCATVCSHLMSFCQNANLN